MPPRGVKWEDIGPEGWCVLAVIVAFIVLGEAAVFAQNWRIGVLGLVPVGCVAASLFPPSWWD